MKTADWLPRDGDWSTHAACLDEDPELFFPIGESEAAQRQFREAQAVCAGCPVPTPCLTFALKANVTYGVWGGTDPKERARMRRRIEIINSGKPSRVIKARVTRIPGR